MNYEERITKIIKLDLKLRCSGHVYVIVAMLIYLLIELLKLETLQLKVNLIMRPIKRVILENCTPFNNFMSRINNTQLDDAYEIDVVMSMYNLIEYSDNCSKTSRILWQYCRDEPALNFNNANATTNLFKLKEKITG